MSPASKSDALRALLDRPNPHDITAAADGERRHRFGLDTTVVATDHLDPQGVHRWSTVTGEMAPEGGFARTLDGIADVATELVVLPPPQTDAAGLLGLLDLLPPPPPVGEGEALPTVQVGCADDWIAAAAGEADATAVLRELRARGVRVLSDGVFPTHHPVRGVEAAVRWESFWRSAAAAGLRGHAVVLYGPDHGLESVFAQLERIAALQRDTGVFLSLAPCIFAPDGFGGPDDHKLTQASLDLRVLAACRLFETGVEHSSLRYERSDLKSAHTALLCGVDDLVGHLFLGARDRRADADATDLSVAEMRKWLEEAGFPAFLRNGAFERIDFDSALALFGDLPSSSPPEAGA